MLVDRRITFVICVLAFTQVIGWGTVSLPSIAGREMAADLGMTLSAVFAGTSVLHVVMGLCSPLLARPFGAWGPRLVMIVGTIVSAVGFLGLALSHGPIAWFLAWVLLGAGGAATLTTAAHIVLSDVAGARAKGAIGLLMLATGLSSSVFWPVGAALVHAIGWRGTCVVYALLLLAVSVPMYVFGLPKMSTPAATASAGTRSSPAATSSSTFLLIVAAIALNSFVTYGFAAILIELLKAAGLPPAQAVAFGSALGVIQVGARAVDVLGGGRWDGISTGILAGVALPLSLALLLVGAGSLWVVAAFLLLYGLSTGALAVARATIPLVFYRKAEYAAAASRIALPLNLLSAAAPPLLAATLDSLGLQAVLAIAIGCSSAALVLLLMLARRRPPVPATTAA